MYRLVRIGLVQLFVVLVAWQTLSALHLLAVNGSVPPLESVVGALGTSVREGTLVAAALGSLFRISLGYLIGVSAAMFVGLVCGLNRSFNAIFGTPIDLLRPIPCLAWVPIAIVIAGAGTATAIIVVAIAVFFPMFVATRDGVTSAQKDHVLMVKSLGATPWQVFVTVLLPAGLPRILEGGRIALGLAWVAVIASEFVGTAGGLGELVVKSQYAAQVPLMIVGIIGIGLLGLGMDGLYRSYQRRLIAWQPRFPH